MTPNFVNIAKPTVGKQSFLKPIFTFFIAGALMSTFTNVQAQAQRGHEEVVTEIIATTKEIVTIAEMTDVTTTAETTIVAMNIVDDEYRRDDRRIRPCCCS
jgi:hypothetical protein